MNGGGDTKTGTFNAIFNPTGNYSYYVWVNDTLPAGVTYVSDTSGLTPTVNGDTYTYPFTNLAGGPSDRRFSKWYCSDLENWINGNYKRISAASERRERFP